jgi:hypothetical protein
MDIRTIQNRIASLENKYRCLACSSGGVYTFNSGITETTGTVNLGGSLTQNADINGMVDYRFDAYNLSDFGLQTAIQTAMGRSGIGGFNGNLELWHRWESGTANQAYIKAETNGTVSSLILRAATTSFSKEIEILDTVIKIKGVPEYADDAAAATGGLPIEGIYRTGSVLKVRVA